MIAARISHILVHFGTLNSENDAAVIACEYGEKVGSEV